MQWTKFEDQGSKNIQYIFSIVTNRQVTKKHIQPKVHQISSKNNKPTLTSKLP